jgi:hypothetical protein
MKETKLKVAPSNLNTLICSSFKEQILTCKFILSLYTKLLVFSSNLDV